MWSNAQKLMADSWSVAAGPLARAHEDKVLAWESWVNKALAQQRKWSQNAVERAAHWPGLPKPMGVLMEQTQAANGRFFALQDQLWGRWFELLKTSHPQAANEAPPQAPSEAAAVVQAPAERALEAEDDLTAITGVGPAIEGKLKAAGVSTYRAIAAWSEADIERMESTVLGGRFSGRIRRDDWIDQARWLHAEKYGRAV